MAKTVKLTKKQLSSLLAYQGGEFTTILGALKRLREMGVPMGPFEWAWKKQSGPCMLGAIRHHVGVAQ